MGCSRVWMMIGSLVAMVSIPVFGQGDGVFGPVPGGMLPTDITQLAPVPTQALTFIVIPLYHMSAELVAYAVRADDIIWDTPQGGGSSGYGQSGRSGSGSGSSGGRGRSSGGGSSRGGYQ